MGLFSITSGLIQRLYGNSWGRRITDSEGVKRDTGVDEFVQELVGGLSSHEPIVAQGTFVIDASNLNAPAIRIITGPDGKGGIELLDSRVMSQLYASGLLQPGAQGPPVPGSALLEGPNTPPGLGGGGGVGSVNPSPPSPPGSGGTGSTLTVVTGVSLSLSAAVSGCEVTISPSLTVTTQTIEVT